MATIRNAVASSSRSVPDFATPYLVISGLPRTALPRDVYAALKRAKALGDDTGRQLTIADIHKRPTDPRAPSNALDSSFHVTYPTRAASSRASDLLRQNPPFFALHRPSGGLAEGTRARGLRVDYASKKAGLWYREHLEGMLSEANARADRGPAVGQEAGAAAAAAPFREWRSEVRRLIDEKKVAPVNEALRGRQVMLQGMPAGLEHNRLRRAMPDYHISDLDGVMRLPGYAPPERGATYLVTLPSVAEAHRLVRQLHLTYWNNREYDIESGRRHAVIQASVVW